jgi:hypothetical protein
MKLYTCFSIREAVRSHLRPRALQGLFSQNNLLKALLIILPSIILPLFPTAPPRGKLKRKNELQTRFLCGLPGKIVLFTFR